MTEDWRDHNFKNRTSTKGKKKPAQRKNVVGSMSAATANNVDQFSKRTSPITIVAIIIATIATLFALYSIFKPPNDDLPSQLNKRIGQLSAINDSQGKTISEQENTIKVQDKTIAVQETTIRNFGREVTNLKNKYELSENTINKLCKSAYGLDDLANDGNIKREMISNCVSFFEQ